MSSFPTEKNHHHWWLVTGTRWNRLHALPEALWDRWDDEQVDLLCDYPGPTATALCGYEGPWQMPGVFTRIGAPRCAHCCRKLGIERGDGTPNNMPRFNL